MYHVYVDGFLRTTVRASDKTRALVEGVDCARVSWIWLYSKTSKLYGILLIRAHIFGNYHLTLKLQQPHRISVRSVTVNRKTSKDAACTMIIGKNLR